MTDSAAPEDFSWEFTVERQTAVDYARAIGVTDPIFYDENAAAAAGFRSIPVVPTFPAILYGMNEFQGIAPPAVKRSYNELVSNPLGENLDFSKGLHGGDMFRFRRPLCVGDRVRVRLDPNADRFEKQGKSGKLVFIVLEMIVEEPDGDTILTDRMTAIVRQ